VQAEFAVLGPVLVVAEEHDRQELVVAEVVLADNLVEG